VKINAGAGAVVIGAFKLWLLYFTKMRQLLLYKTEKNKMKTGVKVQRFSEINIESVNKKLKK
jgi:hypothetical protein